MTTTTTTTHPTPRTGITGRRTILYRVRRMDATTGEITGTRYYAQRPAALARARRWEAAGYTVALDVSTLRVGFRRHPLP